MIDRMSPLKEVHCKAAGVFSFRQSMPVKGNAACLRLVKQQVLPKSGRKTTLIPDAEESVSRHRA